MNASQLEILRERLLQTARKGTRRGTDIAVFALAAKQGAFALSDVELEAELTYLVGRGKLSETGGDVSKANIRWHITPAGHEYLETVGL